MISLLKKIAIVGAVGTTIAGTMAVPVQAREGGAIAAGVLGGLAVGAIAGSAAANNGYYDRGYAPAYAAPVYGGGCYLERRPVYDEYGEVVGHRRVRVCE